MTERKKLRETVAAWFAVAVAFVAARLSAAAATVSASAWDLLEVAGLALIAVGVSLWSIPAGLVTAGLVLLLIVYPVIPKRWRR